MPSALIVDDTGPDGAVRREVSRAQPALEVQGTVRSLREAMHRVAVSPPDFVYLRWEAAVEMQPEALNFLTLRTRLVFVTAYGSHMVQPVPSADKKVRKPGDWSLSGHGNGFAAPGPAKASAVSGLVAPPVLAPPDAGGATAQAAIRPVNAPEQIDLVPLEDILWIEAAQNYTKVCRRNAGADFLYHRTMAAWQKTLPAVLFQRLSRSVIVRLDSMRSLTTCGKNSAYVSFRNSSKQLRLGRTAAYRLKASVRWQAELSD